MLSQFSLWSIFHFKICKQFVLEFYKHYWYEHPLQSITHIHSSSAYCSLKVYQLYAGADLLRCSLAVKMLNEVLIWFLSPFMTHNKISSLIKCMKMQPKGSLQNMQKREREWVIEIKRKNVAERKSIRWGKRRRFQIPGIHFLSNRTNRLLKNLHFLCDVLALSLNHFSLYPFGQIDSESKITPDVL